MGLAGRQAQNELVSAQARSNLVNCPRQIPTCLVTSDVLDSIGNTPMIRLRHVSDETGCEIYAQYGGLANVAVIMRLDLCSEPHECLPGPCGLQILQGHRGVSSIRR